MLALNEALENLAKYDERKAKVVELRFLGGMTVAEVADTLAISVSTAEADWAFARAWLCEALEGS